MRTSDVQQGYLSLKRAAAYADVSVKTVQRWIKAGLPVYQGTMRGKVLIRPADIDAYLTRKHAPRLELGAMVDDVMRSLDERTKVA